MKNSTSRSYAIARKRVEKIERFYKHVITYLVCNVILLSIKTEGFSFLMEKGVSDPKFFEWLHWNIVGTTIIWGLGLLGHGLYVFKVEGRSWSLKPVFLKRWEEKQLKKYMQEDQKGP